jgi:tetratricopeptide (TPR) repeat protein
MSKRRKPLNLLRITFLAAIVGMAIYVNQVIVPTVQPIGVPTATPTRDPESYVTDAEQLAQQGKFNQAIDAYSQVIQARPKDAASYVAMARLQVWVGQYAEAQKNAEYALLLNPNYAIAHAVRGWALDFQGKYGDAETSIKRALALDPNNALAHAYYAELLGDMYGSSTGPLDAIQRASDESKTALALDPKLLEAHRARGYILYLGQNYQLAVGEYQAAIAIDNHIEDLQINLGLNYMALNLPDDAVTALNLAISLNPTDPLPNLYISRVDAGVGKYVQALQYAQDAVKNAPADASLHGNLGEMYYRNFKYSSAAQELALALYGGSTADGTVVQALDLNNSVRAPEYLYTYGLVLAKSDQCGAALPIAQQILDKLRGNDVAVFNANEINRLCTLSAQATSTPAKTPAAPAATPTS